ncbi:DUF3846 domain-containing protein [Candidatus Pacearchaeota archaeon]|nr:DUF3846 domain-containing protein [Candidatus Pacearchaeota archaeon]
MAKFKLMASGAKASFGYKVTLENLQKAVDGSIDVIFVDPTTLMIINQEGLLLKLPKNNKASRMIKQTIVGDVVILTDEDKKEYMRSDI